ncbi:MAG: hypothetical protein R6U29_01665, partial [Desulfosudaceae bacterium]
VFLSCLGLLFSRTLSPLVVVSVVLALLCGWLLVRLLRQGFKTIGPWQRFVSAAGVIVLALLIYLPFLRNILSLGGRYTVGQADSFNREVLLNGFRDFDLKPLWKAFVVQTEPLTIVLALLVLLAPLLILSRRKREPGLVAILFLLPGFALVNIFVFGAKSDRPFRPAYAIYLLPLVMVLAAASFDILATFFLERVRQRVAKVRAIRWAGLIPAAVLALMIAVSCQSMIDYKQTRKKADWRGLAAYLAAAYDENNLLLFDSLESSGGWEPTFYGFPRYYQGDSYLLSLASIPLNTSEMARLSLEPILVLYQWRELSLTPSSPYPIFPLSGDRKTLNYDKIMAEPAFNIKELPGFLVIELKNPPDNLADNLVRASLLLCERLLDSLPAGAPVADIEKARASLEKVRPVGEE